MAFTIDTSQLNRLTADLLKSESTAKKMASLAIRKTALDCQASAQRRAPVDTGALRNSIGTEFGDSGMSALIGPTVNYGAYVEFGTSRMSAQPYMSPAMDEVTPGFISALEQIGKGLL